MCWLFNKKASAFTTRLFSCPEALFGRDVKTEGEKGRQIGKGWEGRGQVCFPPCCFSWKREGKETQRLSGWEGK